MSDYSEFHSEWPLTKFYFKVSIAGAPELRFQSCDGLEASIASIEFRDGNSSAFHKEKRPTMTTFSNVTLKKGMYKGDTPLNTWFKNVSQGSWLADRRDMSIELWGEDRVIVRWELDKAYVVKYVPTPLDSTADTEVAIEEVELAYQKFEMSFL